MRAWRDVLAQLLSGDTEKHTFLSLSSRVEHPVNAFIHFMHRKKRDLKPHRSDLVKFISLAGRRGGGGPRKFHTIPNINRKFLLNTRVSAGKENKESSWECRSGHSKAKDKKASSLPPGGRQKSSPTEGIMHGATKVSSRRETTEEEQRAGVVEGTCEEPIGGGYLRPRREGHAGQEEPTGRMVVMNPQ